MIGRPLGRVTRSNQFRSGGESGGICGSLQLSLDQVQAANVGGHDQQTENDEREQEEVDARHTAL
jgi:hypothetical protein